MEMDFCIGDHGGWQVKLWKFYVQCRLVFLHFLLSTFFLSLSLSFFSFNVFFFFWKDRRCLFSFEQIFEGEID